MRLNRLSSLTALCALAMLAHARPAAAQEGIEELCELLLQQARVEVEDLELGVEVERTELLVAEELFDMADSLWNNDLITSALHLDAQHRRDVARIVSEFAEAMLTRERAALDQYELACSQDAPPEPSAGRIPIEEARQRYVEADCALRELDEALSRVDLEYQNEVLNRSRELRRSGIASRVEVLFAERNTNVTTYRLRLARQRAARCQR